MNKCKYCDNDALFTYNSTMDGVEEGLISLCMDCMKSTFPKELNNDNDNKDNVVDLKVVKGNKRQEAIDNVKEFKVTLSEVAKSDIVIKADTKEEAEGRALSMAENGKCAWEYAAIEITNVEELNKGGNNA